MLKVQVQPLLQQEVPGTADTVQWRALSSGGRCVAVVTM